MRFTRRSFLLGASSAAFAPSVAWADDKERFNPRSIAVGDVGARHATFWCRARRDGRMRLQIAENPEFSNPRELWGPFTGADSDFTARTLVDELPVNTRLYWRAMVDHWGVPSEWMVGSFRTAGPDRDVRFAWGGDTGGQGYGIDDTRGGMRIFEAIRTHKPDFLIHCGDLAYADQPFKKRVALHDGQTWHNVVTPETGKVSETLPELRGRFRYNHIDDNFRNMLTEVPVLHMWDDHEVYNNFWPGKPIHDIRYRATNTNQLIGPAKRAFFEYTPIDGDRIWRNVKYGPLLEVFLLDTRSERAANSENHQKTYGPDCHWLGPQQRDWLKAGLKDSTSLWKVIACDMPLGIRSGGAKKGSDNASNGNGVPLGRELEIADILSFMKQNGVRNVVWLTADLHYATCTRYHPDEAVFKDFDPFWEFMAGPLNAGTGMHHPLDDTFGAKTEWISIPEDLPRHAPPTDGYQFYGIVEISSATRSFTVRFFNADAKELHSMVLPAEGA